MLRLDTPIRSLSRLALEPVTIGGVDIPAGAVVPINAGGPNRLRKFADPDAFRIDRPSVRDHVSFSRGAHP